MRFYLFRYRSGHTREHDDEVEQAAWMSADEALRRLSYENERKIFLKAQRYLKNRTGFHLEQKAGA